MRTYNIFVFIFMTVVKNFLANFTIPASPKVSISILSFSIPSLKNRSESFRTLINRSRSSLPPINIVSVSIRDNISTIKQPISGCIMDISAIVFTHASLLRTFFNDFHINSYIQRFRPESISELSNPPPFSSSSAGNEDRMHFKL